MAMYDWTEGKFGVDFDEYGPLPASLDDPRRPYGTGAPTFSDWLLVCGIASIAGMSAGDPRIATIHDLRVLVMVFFPTRENSCFVWGWNGRCEVERAARLSLGHLEVNMSPEAFSAVWSLYVRWLDHCGRFVKGLHEAASSILRDEDALAQTKIRFMRWWQESARRRSDKSFDERSGYLKQIFALRAELAAMKAPA